MRSEQHHPAGTPFHHRAGARRLTNPSLCVPPSSRIKTWSPADLYCPQGAIVVLTERQTTFKYPPHPSSSPSAVLFSHPICPCVINLLRLLLCSVLSHHHYYHHHQHHNHNPTT